MSNFTADNKCVGLVIEVVSQVSALENLKKHLTDLVRECFVDDLDVLFLQGDKEAITSNGIRTARISSLDGKSQSRQILESFKAMWEFGCNERFYLILITNLPVNLTEMKKVAKQNERKKFGANLLCISLRNNDVVVDGWDMAVCRVDEVKKVLENVYG